MRYRITVRGESPRVELRGYFDGDYARLALFSDLMTPYGIVVASPAEDDYDPFDTGVSDTKVSFTCPRCGMSSHHPVDIAEGYCGACHDWTGAR